MSYQRDSDGYTRGVHAIAALDGASSRRRIAARSQARALALRDRALSSVIPRRPLSLGAANLTGTVMGTRGGQAILKSGGLQEGTGKTPMGRPQHTGRGSLPPGTPTPPKPIAPPVGTVGTTLPMTLSMSSTKSGSARPRPGGKTPTKGSPQKGSSTVGFRRDQGRKDYQPPAILLPVPPVVMPQPEPPRGSSGGGGTWGGGGGAASASPDPLLEQPLDPLPPAPSSGMSTTTLLLIGGALIGGYYLLTRDEDED